MAQPRKNEPHNNRCHWFRSLTNENDPSNIGRASVVEASPDRAWCFDDVFQLHERSRIVSCSNLLHDDCITVTRDFKERTQMPTCDQFVVVFSPHNHVNAMRQTSATV